jgi:hypothetical protein
LVQAQDQGERLADDGVVDPMIAAPLESQVRERQAVAVHGSRGLV